MNEPYVRFHAYTRGWTDGVTGLPKDPAYAVDAVDITRTEYVDGHQKGGALRLEMYNATLKRTGYVPRFRGPLHGEPITT